MPCFKADAPLVKGKDRLQRRATLQTRKGRRDSLNLRIELSEKSVPIIGAMRKGRVIAVCVMSVR
ncbi:hypothetical protein SJ05684_c16340 [Sinorhizobium sojae CCBAU 05684]|uniref:Uncharacterized protein n=1 Tax=Sinorhizobium sojae CCBAU 05684 TaxID=716928 RepID=A0A249PB66_9HYPH|nr:hypothetical protein SJ05684_c16340 [Sinorhizobium sojae CCBAU 05684]